MSATVRPMRRRTKRTFRSRLRTFWIVVLGASIVLAGAAFEAVRWPGFEPKFIEVSGAAIVDRKDVLERAAIDRHANVWLMNRRAAEARVETLPYVAHANIRVVPPAQVTIALVEREPFGCVIAADGRRFLIDRERRMLEADCGRKQQPMFHGSDINAVPASGSYVKAAALAQMMDAVSDLRNSAAEYTLFDTDTFGELIAVRSDGIVVKFGSTRDLAAKQRLVEPILETVRRRAGGIKAVDVRTPSTPVIEYR